MRTTGELDLEMGGDPQVSRGLEGVGTLGLEGVGPPGLDRLKTQHKMSCSLLLSNLKLGHFPQSSHHLEEVCVLVCVQGDRCAPGLALPSWGPDNQVIECAGLQLVLEVFICLACSLPRRSQGRHLRVGL